MNFRVSFFDLWPAVHGALLLGASAWTVAAQDIHPVLILGPASFAVLLLGTRDRRSSSAALLTWANGITALRLTIILGLAKIALSSSSAPGVYLAAGGLIPLAMDRLDGWLARRNQSSSSLGSLFDQEVDAFFLLLLCLIALLSGRLGAWILIPGFLRYVFSLVLAVLPDPVRTPRSTLRARVLFVVTMLAMLATFLPLPALYRPAAAGSTLLLTFSFAADTWYVTSGKAFRTSLTRLLLKLSRLLSVR